MRYAWPFYNFTLGKNRRDLVGSKSQRRGDSRLWHTRLLLKLVLLLTSYLVLIASVVTTAFAGTLTPQALRVAVPDSCASLLAPEKAVISTLQDMYNDGVLTPQDLIAIRNGENPLEQKHGLNERIYSDVVGTVIAQLKNNVEAQTRLDQLIAELESQSKVQQHEILATSSLYLPMMMYNIEPGTFVMGSARKAKPGYWAEMPHHRVRITKAFRIADTPVTQWQYAFVMHENPSGAFQVPNNDDGRIVSFGGPEFYIWPESPVKSVSIDKENEFIRILNEWSAENNPLIYTIIANHVPYAKIRKLTEAEWEFVARNRGQWEGDYPPGLDDQSVLQHAFSISENDPVNLVPKVRQRKPFLIDGHKPIYDMLSHHWWHRVHDSFHNAYGLSSDELDGESVDPLHEITHGHLYSIRGGTNSIDPDESGIFIGARNGGGGNGLSSGNQVFRIVEVPR